MATRNETVDSTNTSSGKPGGGNFSAFMGIAIVAVILVGMLFLQVSSASPL